MKKSVVSILCLIMILATRGYAQGQSSLVVRETAKKEKTFSAEWRLRLSGADYADEQSQSKLIDIRTEIKAKYLLHSSLYLDLQPALRLQSGTTQFVDGADKAENKISLNQAALVYRPNYGVRGLVGALDQRHMHTTLLMDSIAFPAARAEGMMSAGSVTSIFGIETAMPTSTSLSTNTKELEPTPSLNTANLKMRWQQDKALFVRGSLGYFVYNNLPSAVAQQSGLLGNDVIKASDARFAFVNQYEGLESELEIGFPIARFFDLNLGGEYILNQKAPSDVNSGYRYYVGSNFHISSTLDFVAEGSYFAIAPEAAVAYFNAGGFETNRVGYGAEVYFSFKKQKFNIGAKYTDAEIMFMNPVQSREKTIMLKLETFYADI